MENFGFISNRYASLNGKFARVLALSIVIFVGQTAINPTSSEANYSVDAVISTSASIAFQQGFEACGLGCGAAAALATSTIMYYGPGLASAAVEVVKPTFIQIVSSWGASFFHF